MRVAVVGGGISGLAAAYDLARGGRAEVHLFEATSRLGGVIFTDTIEGCAVEAGPDSFLTEKPQTLELARELGIADEAIGSNDSERRTYILHRDRLEPLPDGLQFLVPTRLLPILTTPLIPVREKIGIVGELFLPPRRTTVDESVADFVRRHFGRGMVDNIADPLLSGIYGGDSSELSAHATLPRFVQMEEQRGSLTRAVLAAPKKASHALFSTFRDGLGRIVEALQARLNNISIHCGTRVGAWEDIAGFEAIILALPAHESARLLRALDAALAEPLAAIPYSSSITIALGYDAEVRRKLPSGFGFLVPRTENRRLLACTFVHSKFPQRVPPEFALLRCFAGGRRDERVLDLSDAEVSLMVRSELRDILGLAAEPRFVRVYRWPRSMAQYTLGHQERVSAIKDRLRSHPGLYLAGNWESGIGISDCIRTGRSVAAQVLGTAR